MRCSLQSRDPACVHLTVGSTAAPTGTFVPDLNHVSYPPTTPEARIHSATEGDPSGTGAFASKIR